MTVWSLWLPGTTIKRRTKLPSEFFHLQMILRVIKQCSLRSDIERQLGSEFGNCYRAVSKTLANPEFPVDVRVRVRQIRNNRGRGNEVSDDFLDDVPAKCG